MSNRIFYIDIIKGFAIFFVVMLHVSALGFSREIVGNEYWNICNAYNSLCRCTVPLFVMVSGALLLHPKKEFHLIKSVKRLAIPLLLWSAFFSFVVTLNTYRCVSSESIIAFLKLTFLTPTQLVSFHVNRSILGSSILKTYCYR